jgi:hypothetical protein
MKSTNHEEHEEHEEYGSTAKSLKMARAHGELKAE